MSTNMETPAPGEFDFEDEPAQRKRATIKRLVIAGAAVALLLAGGVTTWFVLRDNNNDKPSNEANSRAENTRKMRDYARCMRDNGVEMADPGADGGIQMSNRPGEGGPGSADAEKFRTAHEACKKFMPNGGEPPKHSAEEIAQQRAIAKCMRDNGIPMPDPNENGGMSVESGDPQQAQVDPNSETFKNAEKACKHLMPTGGPVRNDKGGGR